MEDTDYRILGLSKVFSKNDLADVGNNRTYVISILSYFATSLFDKNKIDDVLWDITENCISKLGLEDCIIHLLDKEKNLLNKSAAYGNKRSEEHTSKLKS